MEVAGVVLVVVMAVIFLWGAVSARLERADLSAPIFFVAVGAVLAAFSLVGLATFHSRTLGLAARPLMLGALYGTLLIFNWLVVLALSGVGIAQTVMRKDAGPSGPGGPGEPPPASR